MTVKPIIILPDPLLRKVSKPVEKVDSEIKQLTVDILETMYNAVGIGLAAIQIGVARRIIVIDISRENEEKKPLVFINPEIVKFSNERSICEEGCLSIANYYAKVERYTSIIVNYIDSNEKPQTMEAKGLLAICLQHEIDHLNGILFIDHISRVKREMIIKKFTRNIRKSQLIPV